MKKYVDSDCFKEKIANNRRRFETQGIYFNNISDIVFHPTRSSFTSRDFFEKAESRPIFLKIINKELIDYRKMKLVVKRIVSILPKLYCIETIEDYTYFFMEEVKVFQGSKKITFAQFKGIFEIIKKLAKSKIYYTDIHFSNFGYILKDGGKSKVLLIDFTDLFQEDNKSLRVHPGYEPPEESRRVDHATVSFILALFAVEVLFSEDTKERIRRIILQFKDLPSLRDFSPHDFIKIDEFLFLLFRYILIHETLNTKFEIQEKVKEEEKWANTLAGMLKFLPKKRLNIANVRI